MPRGGDDDGRIDGIGVHAGLIIVVHSDQRPISDHARDADAAAHLGARGLDVRAGDEVLDGGGVEELDVGEAQDFREEGGGEEGGVLDDDEIAFVFVGDAQLGEEGVRRFAHYHCGEELAAQPGTAALGVSVSNRSRKDTWIASRACGKGRLTRAYARLNDGNLQIGSLLPQHVRGRQSTRSGTDNDDVAFGIVVQVGEITARHGAGDLGLADWGEGEVGPFAEHACLNGFLRLELGDCCLCGGRRSVDGLGGRRCSVDNGFGRGRSGAIDAILSGEGVRQGGRVVEGCCWWRHDAWLVKSADIG